MRLEALPQKKNIMEVYACRDMEYLYHISLFLKGQF